MDTENHPSDEITKQIKKDMDFDEMLESDKIITMINKCTYEINEAWNRWCRLANMGYISAEEMAALENRCGELQTFSDVLRQRRTNDIQNGR